MQGIHKRLPRERTNGNNNKNMKKKVITTTVLCLTDIKWLQHQHCHYRQQQYQERREERGRFSLHRPAVRKDCRGGRTSLRVCQLQIHGERSTLGKPKQDLEQPVPFFVYFHRDRKSPVIPELHKQDTAYVIRWPWRDSKLCQSSDLGRWQPLPVSHENSYGGANGGMEAILCEGLIRA